MTTPMCILFCSLKPAKSYMYIIHFALPRFRSRCSPVRISRHDDDQQVVLLIARNADQRLDDVMGTADTRREVGRIGNSV